MRDNPPGNAEIFFTVCSDWSRKTCVVFMQRPPIDGIAIAERVDQAPGAYVLPAVGPLRRVALIAGGKVAHVFAQSLVPTKLFVVACVAVALAAGRR